MGRSGSSFEFSQINIKTKSKMTEPTRRPVANSKMLPNTMLNNVMSSHFK